jgi:hypothetical protein
MIAGAAVLGDSRRCRDFSYLPIAAYPPNNGQQRSSCEWRFAPNRQSACGVLNPQEARRARLANGSGQSSDASRCVGILLKENHSSLVVFANVHLVFPYGFSCSFA